jgi:hypothetical protein
MSASIGDFRPYAELFTTETMGQRRDSARALAAYTKDVEWVLCQAIRLCSRTPI